MLTHKVQLIAKIDPLKYLLSKATLIGHLAKWVMIMSEFDIECVGRKAIKGQVIVDQLVDEPLIGDHPLVLNFPDEEIFMITTTQPWKLYFDGSYTRHGSRACIIFITPQGDNIPKLYGLTFLCTNNIAEYETLITGLRLAIQWHLKELKVYGDSKLVIRQVTNEYQTKDDKLMPYKRMVDSYKESFTTITFEQVPRD